MAGAAPLPMRRVLFQDLSLPGQPRDRSRPLGRDPRRRGHRAGQPGRRHRLEDVRRPRRRSRRRRSSSTSCAALTGATRLGRERRRTCSSTPPTGCASSTTSSSSPRFEWAACQTSDGVRRLLLGLRPGHDASARRSRLLGLERAAAVVPPDADRRATGDARACSARATVRSSAATGSPSRFGIWGALNCRAGFVVEDAGELPAAIGDYVERLVGAVLRGGRRVVRARCASARPAARSTTIIDRRLGDPFFGIFLNPGHQIHLDEWVNSPIVARLDDRAPLGDGLPGRHHPGDRHRLLHDQHRGRHRARRRRRCAARSRRATRTPGRGSRRARRSWRDALGIELHPGRAASFSNLPAWLPPFLLRADRAMTMRWAASAVDDRDGLDPHQLPAVPHDRDAHQRARPRPIERWTASQTVTWRSWSRSRDVDGGLHDIAGPRSGRSSGRRSGSPRLAPSVPPGSSAPTTSPVASSGTWRPADEHERGARGRSPRGVAGGEATGSGTFRRSTLMPSNRVARPCLIQARRTAEAS